MNQTPIGVEEVVLAEPRGFCAGVDRAIEIVERALIKFGAPIYVRHEIVHNTYVVNDLKAKGAIFIEDLADVPPGATLVFSAHGVSQAVRREADERYSVGDVVQFPTPDGQGAYAGVVREVDGDILVFDFNHPLAGRPVTFEVKLIGVL